MSFINNLRQLYCNSEIQYKREINQKADEIQKKMEEDARKYTRIGQYVVENRQKGLDIINLLEKRHHELLGSLSLSDIQIVDKPKIIFDATKLGIVKIEKDLFY